MKNVRREETDDDLINGYQSVKRPLPRRRRAPYLVAGRFGSTRPLVGTGPMTQPLASGKSARFDLNEIAKSFPPSADTLLLDTYLTNEDAASSRVFRVYRSTPPHYHATCDEYLYVLSAVDTPRRDPRDIIFVNPADGTPESFIRDKSR